MKVVPLHAETVSDIAGACRQAVRTVALKTAVTEHYLTTHVHGGRCKLNLCSLLCSGLEKRSPSSTRSTAHQSACAHICGVPISLVAGPLLSDKHTVSIVIVIVIVYPRQHAQLAAATCRCGAV